MKDLRKTKVLSWLVDQVLFKWNVNPSVNIYKESLKALPYGQIISI